MTKEERYVLQTPSEGVCVATDTKYGIVVKYEKGKFNDTQEVTVLADVKNPDVKAFAKAMRELSDWLISNHPETLMTPTTKI